MDDQTRQPSRASRAWIPAAVLSGLLLVGVIAATAAFAGPGSGGSDMPTDPITVGAVDEVAALDALLEPDGDEPGGPAADRPLRHGRNGHGPLGLRDGEKVVAGAVSSVADGSLVVRKDNGAEVTVQTDADTKVRGAQNRSLSDLQAGERVVVRVGADGVARGVLAVRAHAAGTVTALDGDRATVVRAGGLSTVLDLSAVEQRPAVGTVVVAVGTATDNGATLKVEKLRELATVN